MDVDLWSKIWSNPLLSASNGQFNNIELICSAQFLTLIFSRCLVENMLHLKDKTVILPYLMTLCVNILR